MNPQGTEFLGGFLIQMGEWDRERSFCIKMVLGDSHTELPVLKSIPEKDLSVNPALDWATLVVAPTFANTPRNPKEPKLSDWKAAYSKTVRKFLICGRPLRTV